MENAAFRKLLVVSSVAISLSSLFAFKYYDLFADTYNHVASQLDLNSHLSYIHLLLPVGLSFYSFKEVSYVIDVYRRKVEAVRDPLIYALFVSFFPQLVAGPLERAKPMFAQLAGRIVPAPSQFEKGIFLVLYGLFLKTSIADVLAPYVGRVFDHTRLPTQQTTIGMVFAATIAFSVQIYCDFAGYSQIARGLAKMVGVELPINFRQPYFARNPQDFWRRWHITLSEWFRDYLYIPLGGSKRGFTVTARNIVFTMAVAGLWHGAGGKFLLWGVYHGFLLVIYHAMRQSQLNYSCPRLVSVAVMTCCSVTGWFLFRCPSLDQMYHLFGSSRLSLDGPAITLIVRVIALSLPVVLVDWMTEAGHAHAIYNKTPWIMRSFLITALLVAIFLGASRNGSAFIYFKF